MKLAEQMSVDKLRGGFYTPPHLVDLCLNRIAELSGGGFTESIFEPSAGDGAFISGIGRHDGFSRLTQLVGVEILESESAKAREATLNLPFKSDVYTANAIEWCTTTDLVFDAAVGNPPFVRYQFTSQDDAVAIARLGQQIGVTFRGVSNLWIPVLLGALSRLRVGGAMAFVVPAELFSGVSAGVARKWLLTNFDTLRVDLFEPGSFPSVLQEIVVISGRRVQPKSDGTPSTIEFSEHVPGGPKRAWQHSLIIDSVGWTPYLLTPNQLSTVIDVSHRPAFRPLKTIARLEVSIVTGANGFFAVSNAECDEFELWPWAKPLLPRIRLTPGLVHSRIDQESIATSNAKAWLLDFGTYMPDPMQFGKPAEYLAQGEAANIHNRYKTSIRKPWYRVPSIWAGPLLLSKRSHFFPRLVLNEAAALTTDTIYRGKMLLEYDGLEPVLVSEFHNSLTILSAEMEGRSFGGGVLELVPSEIGRLIVPVPSPNGRHLSSLDQLARDAATKGSAANSLIDATDELLLERIPSVTRDELDAIRGARSSLLQRRLDRN